VVLGARFVGNDPAHGAEQRFIERFAAHAAKAAQVQSRIKMLEKIERVSLEAESKQVRISFPAGPRSGQQVLRAEGISKSYGSHCVFGNLDVVLHRGERVALVGVNGAGKSTLLRILSRTEEPSSGGVVYGKDVLPAFYSIEASRDLDSEQTIWEDICAAPSAATTQERRNLLGAFLFGGDDIFKKIHVLSGGEKSRLALLKILLRPTNFLILDEPTNHLDLATKEVFQEALLCYQGTLLIVSHDRDFLDHLASRVLEIREQRLHEYLGNYSYFIEKRGPLLADTVTGPTPDVQPRKESAYQLRKDAERARRMSEKKIAGLEKEIEALETRRKELELIFCDPETHKDREKAQELHREWESVPQKLEQLYLQWQELADRKC